MAHGQVRDPDLFLGREPAAQSAGLRTRIDRQPAGDQRNGLHLSHHCSAVRPKGRRTDAARAKPILCRLPDRLGHPVLSPALSAGNFGRTPPRRNGVRSRSLLIWDACRRRDICAAVPGLSVGHFWKWLSLRRALLVCRFRHQRSDLRHRHRDNGVLAGASRAGVRPDRGSCLAATLCVDADPQTVGSQTPGRRGKPREERLPRQHEPRIPHTTQCHHRA